MDDKTGTGKCCKKIAQEVAYASAWRKSMRVFIAWAQLVFEASLQERDGGVEAGGCAETKSARRCVVTVAQSRYGHGLKTCLAN